MYIKKVDASFYHIWQLSRVFKLFISRNFLIKLRNIGYTRSWNEKFDIDHRSDTTNLLLTEKIELSKFSFSRVNRQNGVTTVCVVMSRHKKKEKREERGKKQISTKVKLIRYNKRFSIVLVFDVIASASHSVNRNTIVWRCKGLYYFVLSSRVLASYRRYLRDIAIFRASERDFNKNRASTDVEREREKETTERNDVEIQVIPIKRARFWGALKPVPAQGLVY